MLEFKMCWLVQEGVLCLFSSAKVEIFYGLFLCLWIDVKIDGSKLKTDANEFADNDLELSFILWRKEKWYFLVSPISVYQSNICFDLFGNHLFAIFPKQITLWGFQPSK